MKIVSTTLCNASSTSVLADALKSVIDWVDECLIIDTQDYNRLVCDSHLEVAREIAKEKINTKFTYHWNDDFADARNFALFCTQKVGADWAVTLDPDERLNCKQASAFRESMFLNAPECIMVVHESSAYAKERFIRIPAERKWIGPTHEAFPALGKPWPTLPPEFITFSELEKPKNSYLKKYERDVKILGKYVEINPGSRWFFYLGDAHQILAEMKKENHKESKYHHKKALQAFTCSMKRNDWPEESAVAAFRAAQCAIELGDIGEGLNLAVSGMTYHAGIPELPFIAGLACMERGDLEQAVYWELLAIRCQTMFSERVLSKFLPAYYEGPWDILKACYKAMDAGESLIQVSEKMFLKEKEKRGKLGYKDAYGPYCCGGEIIK